MLTPNHMHTQNKTKMRTYKTKNSSKPELTTVWKLYFYFLLFLYHFFRTRHTFKIENFDNEFVLHNVYVIDGIDYVDTGDFNDQVAGDGIYTSLKSTVGDSSKKKSETRIIKSDKFKFNNKLATNKVKIGCKFRMVYGGASSWFGNSCDGGCIELYDCSFEIEL